MQIVDTALTTLGGILTLL